MDAMTFELPLFLFATFAGAFVAGLSGFAFGLVAASLWLYILTPLQSASLIVAFGLLVQGYSVWKLRGRSRRHSRDNLVRIARLAQGRSARGVPAGCRHRLSDDCALAGREGNLDDRHIQILCDGFALLARGNLAGTEDFRADQRSGVQKGRAHAPVSFRSHSHILTALTAQIAGG